MREANRRGAAAQRVVASAFVLLLTSCAAITRAPYSTPVTLRLQSWVGSIASVAVDVGGGTRSFILDTGGGETMLTPSLASAIGCQPSGRAVGFRATGERIAFTYCDSVTFRLGSMDLLHDRVGVFDLASILPAGLPPVDGVLSLRSFRGQPVTLDLGAGVLTLETPASLQSKTTAMRPLTIRVATGPSGAETTIYVGARIGGRRAWLLLDSGNADRTLLARHVASSAGLEGDEGDALVDVDGLGPIRLAARSRDLIYDGVLDARFMQQWVFTIDLASARAWAAPGKPSAPRATRIGS